MNLASFKLITTAGFALFAMFFGSGNLLYPLAVGVSAGESYPFALLGLLAAGVAIPFLGLVATIISLKKKEDFFEPLGPHVSLAMGLLTLSLMGPLGVGARCVLVASSGLHLVLPALSTELIGFLFLVLCGFLLLRKGSIISVIGRFLTPLLLVGLLVIIFASLNSPETHVTTNLAPLESLKLGGLQGYQMMDLLAAIFFGRSIYDYLQKRLARHPQKKTLKLSLLSGLLGAGMLASLYAGLVAAGAEHATQLLNIEPENRLASLAHIVLGPMALTVSSFVIALACLTTLCVLMELFADFLRLKLLPGKLSRTGSIIFTLALTFSVSLAGFFTLASWIGKALALIYPALIVFSVLRLFEASGKLSRKKVQVLSGLATLLCFILL